MDEYDGGNHIYAPINCGPIGPDGIPRVGQATPASSNEYGPEV
jgi:hypothetical protein